MLLCLLTFDGSQNNFRPPLVCQGVLNSSGTRSGNNTRSSVRCSGKVKNCWDIECLDFLRAKASSIFRISSDADDTTIN